MRTSKRRLEAAVHASGTTMTDIFGVGPVVAAMVIGHTRNINRFADRDHYAAYAGTAPIEFEYGGRSIRRLSLRGNRQLNHAIHIAAVTQIRHRHSPGRAFYDRKLAAGKTKKQALRGGAEAADHRHDLPPTPRRRSTNQSGPGRASGDDSSIQRDRLRTPNTGASEEPLPDPAQR